MKKYGSILLSVALLLCLFWSPALTGEAPLKLIRIAIPNRGVNFMGLIVAQEKGFFREEGLRIELIVMRPGTSLQALIGGNIDLTTMVSTSTRAVLRGHPLRVLMGFSNHPDMTLIVKPEIRKVTDLRGKILAVSGPMNATDMATRLLLKEHGVIPVKEVEIRVLRGNHPLRLAAMRAGHIDGTVAGLPFSAMAVRDGYRILADLADYTKTMTGGLVAKISRVESDPDSLVGVIRATLRGIRLLKRNKGEFKRILKRESGIKDDTLAEEVYQKSLKMMSDTGIPSDEAVREVIAIGKGVQRSKRDLKPSELVDFSLARKAAKGLK